MGPNRGDDCRSEKNDCQPCRNVASLAEAKAAAARLLQAATVSRGATACQKTLAARGSWKIVTHFPLSGGPTVAHFCIPATATRRPRVYYSQKLSESTFICYH